MLKYLLCFILVLVALVQGAYAQKSITPTAPSAPVTPETKSNLPDGKAGLVYIVPIQGEIMDRGIAYFVRHSVQQAKENNAGLIIFEIDTPGGAVQFGNEYTLGICSAIEDAAPIPTAAYITRWAMSAGVLISISTDRIIMKSGSSIGAAEVIVSGGGDMSQHQGKFTSAYAGHFRSTAQKKGYPANLVMAMVDKDMVVKEVIVDGKKMYLTPGEIQEESKTKTVVEGKTVTKENQPLTLSALDAVEYGLASIIKETREEVPALFGISNPVYKHTTPTWSEALVMYITSPVISAILILAGLIAAGMSLKMPGFGVPEVIAIVCFGLVFFGNYLIGLAEVTEALIIFLGVGLIAVEIFLLPGFGIFGISGIILMGVGLILSMQSFTLPDIKTAPWQMEILQKNLVVVGAAFVSAVVVFLLFVRYLSAVPFFNKLILSAEVKGGQGFATVEQNIPALVGRKGIVFSALRPVGKITLLGPDGKETGETYDVVTEDSFIDKGAKVVIIEVDGSRIIVEKTT